MSVADKIISLHSRARVFHFAVRVWIHLQGDDVQEKVYDHDELILIGAIATRKAIRDIERNGFPDGDRIDGQKQANFST